MAFGHQLLLHTTDTYPKLSHVKQLKKYLNHWLLKSKITKFIDFHSIFEIMNFKLFIYINILFTLIFIVSFRGVNKVF